MTDDLFVPTTTANPKKRRRHLRDLDGDDEPIAARHKPKLQKPRFEDSVLPRHLEMFQTAAVQSTPNAAKIIERIAEPWNQYIEMHRKLIESPEQIIESYEGMNKDRFDAHSVSVYNKLLATKYQIVTWFLASSFLCSSTRIDIEILYKAGADMASPEEVVNRCIAKYGRDLTVYPPLWVDLAFLNSCKAFFKGQSRATYCNGLIDHLKTYMVWEDNPACHDWIQFMTKHVKVYASELYDKDFSMIDKAGTKRDFGPSPTQPLVRCACVLYKTCH
jgi:hypothetical protein